MTINAARKIISLTGPNCSFGNTNACQVDGAAVPPSYTPVWSENFNAYSNGVPLTSGVVFTDAGRTVADTSVRYGASGASALLILEE